jgi:hypothetical protein
VSLTNRDTNDKHNQQADARGNGKDSSSAPQGSADEN